MTWNKLYDANHVPSDGDIGQFISEAKQNFDELVLHIEETYKAKKQLDYSKCSLLFMA